MQWVYKPDGISPIADGCKQYWVLMSKLYATVGIDWQPGQRLQSSCCDLEGHTIPKQVRTTFSALAAGPVSRSGVEILVFTSWLWYRPWLQSHISLIGYWLLVEAACGDQADATGESRGFWHDLNSLVNSHVSTEEMRMYEPWLADNLHPACKSVSLNSLLQVPKFNRCLAMSSVSTVGRAIRYPIRTCREDLSHPSNLKQAKTFLWTVLTPSCCTRMPHRLCWGSVWSPLWWPQRPQSSHDRGSRSDLEDTPSEV